MKKSEASVLKQDRNWKNTARYLSDRRPEFPAYLRQISLCFLYIWNSTDEMHKEGADQWHMI